MGKKILLISGILASLVRVAADVVSAFLYPGYSFRDQTMSQLAAAGAPTQKLQIILLGVFDVLMVAFGLGVWKLGSGKRLQRITGILLFIFGLTGIIITVFFPQSAMQLEEGIAPQIPHIIATVFGMLLIFLFIGFGAYTQGKSFRIFSFSMIFTMIFFAAITATQAPKGVNFGYPWMGILERASYYSYLVWILVFAIVLLKPQKAKNLF